MIAFIKLWWWWNITLGRDEFSPRISTYNLYTKYSSRYNNRELGEMSYARPILAHELDLDDSISNIWKYSQSLYYIKAKL